MYKYKYKERYTEEIIKLWMNKLKVIKIIHLTLKIYPTSITMHKLGVEWRLQALNLKVGAKACKGNRGRKSVAWQHIKN